MNYIKKAVYFLILSQICLDTILLNELMIIYLSIFIHLIYIFLKNLSKHFFN